MKKIIMYFGLVNWVLANCSQVQATSSAMYGRGASTMPMQQVQQKVREFEAAVFQASVAYGKDLYIEIERLFYDLGTNVDKIDANVLKRLRFYFQEMSIKAYVPSYGKFASAQAYEAETSRRLQTIYARAKSIPVTMNQMQLVTRLRQFEVVLMAKAKEHDQLIDQLSDHLMATVPANLIDKNVARRVDDYAKLIKYVL